MRGQPGDGGLYFPERIPRLSREFLAEFRSWPKEKIAFEVIRPYIGGAIADDDLFNICKETVDFDFPLNAGPETKLHLAGVLLRRALPSLLNPA